MAEPIDPEVAALYALPLDAFVAERNRLAATRRAAGDRASADAVRALPKPSRSAWLVNQLTRTASADLEALFACAAAVRAGDRAAAAEHRAVLDRLRAGAAEAARTAGWPDDEALLRRVTLTLSALAATGSFAPDLPGQLARDRDPPGFEALADLPAPVPPAPTAAEASLALLEARRKLEADAAEALRALEAARAGLAAAELGLTRARATYADARAAAERALTALGTV